MIEINAKYVNPIKLVKELIDEGIAPILTTNDRSEGNHVAENTLLKFHDQVDTELVQRIIDKHDSTALEKEPSEIEKLKQALAELTILISRGGM